MYRNVGDTLPITQIHEDDLVRSAKLDRDDIGKWCFIMCGTYQGFYDSLQEAQDRVNQLMTD
jgi:hypothetical protein